MKKFEFLSQTEFITNLNFSQIFVTNLNEFLSNFHEEDSKLKRCNATVSEKSFVNNIWEINLK